jgi:hypothetical protein
VAEVGRRPALHGRDAEVVSRAGSSPTWSTVRQGSQDIRRGDALRLAERAEVIAERLGDTALLAHALGSVAFFEGDLTGVIATARYERALGLEARAGSHIGDDSAAFDHGQQPLDVWPLEQARVIFERLVTTARVGGHGTPALYLDKLAFVELCAGHLAAASDLAHEAVDLASQFGRSTTEMGALFRLGWIEGLRGHVDVARAAGEASIPPGHRHQRLPPRRPPVARVAGELTGGPRHRVGVPRPRRSGHRRGARAAGRPRAGDGRGPGRARTDRRSARQAHPVRGASGRSRRVAAPLTSDPTNRRGDRVARRA